MKDIVLKHSVYTLLQGIMGVVFIVHCSLETLTRINTAHNNVCVCVCLRANSPGSHMLTLITYQSSNTLVSRLQPNSLNNHEDPEKMKSHPNRACGSHDQWFPSHID